MRVLLDENLTPKLPAFLPRHDVSTVLHRGWAGLGNGELLAAAEEAGFEVFVTGDRNLSYQQRLGGRRIAVLVLTAHHWPILRHHTAAIAAAVDRAVPGGFELVACGEFSRGQKG